MSPELFDTEAPKGDAPQRSQRGGTAGGGEGGGTAAEPTLRLRDATPCRGGKVLSRRYMLVLT